MRGTGQELPSREAATDRRELFGGSCGCAPCRMLRAEIRRQFYLLYEVQKYMPICVWRRADLAAAREYKRRCVALGARLGLP